MEKYYWNPSRDDRIGVATGIFKDDGISGADVENIVDSFPGQSIDFFGALRARVYDDAVREFISGTGLEGLSKKLVNVREKPQFPKPTMNVNQLLEYGNRLVQEQDNVKRIQLADAYLDGAELAGTGGTSMPENQGATGAPPAPAYQAPAPAYQAPAPTPVPAYQPPAPTPVPAYEAPAPVAPQATNSFW
eukprot:1056963-Prorocentrum_minimum.AAC.3